MKNLLIKYQFLIFQVIAHITSIWAIYYYSLSDWLLVIPFYILFAGVGISITFHRYCTHHAFVFPSWMKIFGLLCGTLNGHGPSIGWAYKHALHHVTSDTESDPHSPVFNNHWKLYWTNLLYGIKLHHSYTYFDFKNHIKSLDRYDNFFDTYYWWIHLGYLTILANLGLNWVVFAYLVPSALSWFAFGYGVVIASHYNGPVKYQLGDNSRNNRLVSLLVFGEGYQNNHHAFPGDGKYSRSTGELDPLGWMFKKFFNNPQKGSNIT